MEVSGEQEETERDFAETLQSQEPKPCVWEGELETSRRELMDGSLQGGEGCAKGPSWPVVLQLQNRCIAGPQPSICMERNRRSIVAGDTLLRETEVSASQPDLCLGLGRCRDDQGLSGLRLLPSLLFHMGTNVTARDFKHIRRDYMDFGVLAKGMGAHVVSPQSGWWRGTTNTIRVTGTCWDSSHNWSAVMGRYRVFRKEAGRQGGVEADMWRSSSDVWSSWMGQTVGWVRACGSGQGLVISNGASLVGVC